MRRNQGKGVQGPGALGGEAGGKAPGDSPWGKIVLCLLFTLALLLWTAPAFAADPAADSAPDSAARYAEHCAQCHGADRLGGMGPALLPENLGRLKKAEAEAVIARGRPLTQMAGFADKLNAAEIKALSEWVFTPLAAVPEWGQEQIAASREVDAAALASSPAKPVHGADPLNLFVVVETGDSHATILDGDKLEPIHRFQTRFALHGGPKFSPDGRFVYFASRDGWITKFDLYALKVVAEIRAGINTRNLALSADGKVVMVGNYLPHSLVILSADDLAPLKVIPVADALGKQSSRVSAVYQAAPRNSFVVALKDLPELWEISWLENPPPVFTGLVHSHEAGMVEALASKGRFPIRRIAIDEPMDDFLFDSSYNTLFGSARDGGKAVVVNMIVGRPVASVAMPGLPHLASGITWSIDGREVAATPDLKMGAVSVFDLKTWQLIKKIDTLGPGFFLRGHENSRYVWVDCSFSKERDALQVIDRQTLEVVKTLRPAPGKTAFHIEFDRYGRYALASIAEAEGAVVVYDAVTLEEVKRLPMRKPSGKYNVFNKITRSAGTSH